MFAQLSVDLAMPPALAVFISALKPPDPESPKKLFWTRIRDRLLVVECCVVSYAVC
jgi:hypothetical protein